MWTTPPALHVPAKYCAHYKPVNLHISYSTAAISPDCRWEVISMGDDDIEAGKNPTAFHLPKFNARSRYRAFVVERATGRITYQFAMERSATIHWLRDNRHMIVNYFEGSGATNPLLFALKPAPRHEPTDLSATVWLSVLKRAKVHDKRPYGVNRWTYHYYVNFVEDSGNRLIISAEPWYTRNGHDGPGIVKCYIYSVNKTTLRYRFLREDDIESCPHNRYEKWN